MIEIKTTLKCPHCEATNVVKNGKKYAYSMLIIVKVEKVPYHFTYLNTQSLGYIKYIDLTFEGFDT